MTGGHGLDGDGNIRLPRLRDSSPISSVSRPTGLIELVVDMVGDKRRLKCVRKTTALDLTLTKIQVWNELLIESGIEETTICGKTAKTKEMNYLGPYINVTILKN